MTVYGIKSLRQIQMSRETALGTPTTDYAVWRGTGVLKDNRVTEFPPEDVGIFGGVDRSYTPKKGGELSMDDTPATFEQLGYIFDAGFYEASPTSDVGGTGFSRTYTLPITSATVKASTDLQTYGFKGGDNVDVEYMKGAFVRTLSLSGSAGEALMLGAVWDGQSVESDTDGFGTATTPAVEEILFGNAKLYIDESTGTIGTSQITGAFISMGLDITTGWKGIFTGDGTIEHSDAKQTMPEIVLNVTFEHVAAAVTEKTAWRNHTPRLIRVILLGDALTTAGAVYTYKTLILDMAGKWESFDGLGDDGNGDDIVTGVFRVRYNADAAKYFEAVLVNETSAY